MSQQLATVQPAVVLVEPRAILALLDPPGRPGQRRRMLEYAGRDSARRPLPGSN